MYLFGKYVEKDAAKGKEYLEIGIEGNVLEAMYARVRMYEYGFGEEVNSCKAMELYKKPLNFTILGLSSILLN